MNILVDTSRKAKELWKIKWLKTFSILFYLKCLLDIFEFFFDEGIINIYKYIQQLWNYFLRKNLVDKFNRNDRIMKKWNDWKLIFLFCSQPTVF